MYPGHWATLKPNTTAVLNCETGVQLTWAELEAQSNQVAQLLFARGLRPGDHVALLMENHLDYFIISWGALRSGLYLTCINRYLTASEVAYIVNDSCSSALFVSSELPVAAALEAHLHNCPHRFSKGAVAGYEAYQKLLDMQPNYPLAEQPMGDTLLYSSGTTGRPKGIKRPLTGQTIEHGIPGVEPNNPYGIDQHTRYLSPAPLYHAAPFGYCMRTLSLGGSVYMMERFDPQSSLKNIEHHQITHSQWVPTMFVRMLNLPTEALGQYDLSSHQCAIHAAAPCPVEIKQRMMRWWGPILWEYYAGTERNGSTIISPEQWLEYPGSVGRAHSGTLHICDEAGNELPIGMEGLVYFEQTHRPFEYHNAPDKTTQATHPQQTSWTSLGDVGFINSEGYLFLTDRKAFMIISGGVNIYPREIEDVLILHEQVQDVAVFGIPNPEFGEEVKAIIEAKPGTEKNEQLIEDITTYAREHLASYKVPKSIDFTNQLPRLPTGKLLKRLLRDPFWTKT